MSGDTGYDQKAGLASPLGDGGRAGVEEPTVREEEGGGAGATSLEAKAGGEQVRDALHSQEEHPRVGHTPGLGAGDASVFGLVLWSQGGSRGGSCRPRAESESPGAPILWPTRLQRRPGSLLEKPGCFRFC